MKLNNYSFLLFLVAFLPGILSCSGAKMSNSPVVMPKQNVSAEPQTVTDLILVRDIFNRQTYPLSKISNQLPVFIEISASWCPACSEMNKTVDKLSEYFKGKVFFIRLFMAGDGQIDEESNIPVMEILNSPESVGIEFSEALPRTIILSRNGTEIVADITGTYPMIYYYGVLSEL